MRRADVQRILADHQAELQRFGVKSLSLFGSVARDEATASCDIDLLVEFDRAVGLFRLLELQQFLEDILRADVDLGTVDSLKPAVRARVLSECVHVG